MESTAADDAWVRDLLLQGDWLTDPSRASAAAQSLAARDPAVDPGGSATRALLTALAGAWERGWQPADVVHAVGREGTVRARRLAVALIAADARVNGAATRAPHAWLAQLRDLGALEGGDAAVVSSWHRAEGRPATEAWRVVLVLATTLRTLARIEQLVPPPCRWGSGGGSTGASSPGAGSPGASSSGAGSAGASDARALRRIRGLLAKAESSDFPDEAEALTAKAQELMARHALGVVVLEASAADRGTPARGAVGTRRVHVDDPYVRAKTQLLGAVADANGVRLVWYQGLGIATLVGAPTDLDTVELLFTSLLLQVAQPLASAQAQAGRRQASRSFRRAFLLGYAHRVGERLVAARERVTAQAAAEHGADLLPVLRARQDAVDATFDELFPRVRTSRTRASVDGGGWYAGRAAAEHADVGPRRPSVR